MIALNARATSQINALLSAGVTVDNVYQKNQQQKQKQRHRQQQQQLQQQKQQEKHQQQHHQQQQQQQKQPTFVKLALGPVVDADIEAPPYADINGTRGIWRSVHTVLIAETGQKLFDIVPPKLRGKFFGFRGCNVYKAGLPVGTMCTPWDNDVCLAVRDWDSYENDWMSGYHAQRKIHEALDALSKYLGHWLMDPYEYASTLPDYQYSSSSIQRWKSDVFMKHPIHLELESFSDGTVSVNIDLKVYSEESPPASCPPWAYGKYSQEEF